MILLPFNAEKGRDDNVADMIPIIFQIITKVLSPTSANQHNLYLIIQHFDLEHKN